MGKGLTDQAALAYRQPMPVTRAVRYRTAGLYPVCPRCASSLEREYQDYCDRCGQRLDWRQYHRAQVVRII